MRLLLQSKNAKSRDGWKEFEAIAVAQARASCMVNSEPASSAFRPSPSMRLVSAGGRKNRRPGGYIS